MTDEQLIKKYKIKKTDRVLDIGGSMMQHDLIKVDTLVDLIRPEEATYGTSDMVAKNFVQLDITKQKLPFADKEFDFVMCTQTIEDLYNPFLILDEMGRVGKRGLIVSPSMGQDMVFEHIDYTEWLTGARRMPGHAHHKWLLSIEKGILKLVPKIYPILYTSDFQITGWSGDKDIYYYWEKDLKYKEFNGLKMHDIIDEYQKFVNKNKKLITKERTLFFVDDIYNFVKANLKRVLKRGHGYEYRKT
jgi:ubiquinone/menaquinone biosynthesis C-methylase UbiE